MYGAVIANAWKTVNFSMLRMLLQAFHRPPRYNHEKRWVALRLTAAAPHYVITTMSSVLNETLQEQRLRDLNCIESVLLRKYLQIDSLSSIRFTQQSQPHNTRNAFHEAPHSNPWQPPHTRCAIGTVPAALRTSNTQQHWKGHERRRSRRPRRSGVIPREQASTQVRAHLTVATPGHC